MRGCGGTATGGGSLVGAMLGARGCIAYDATTELTDSNGANEPGTGVYTVSVAWQGVAATVAPPATLTCGQNLYPSETDAPRRHGDHAHRRSELAVRNRTMHLRNPSE